VRVHLVDGTYELFRHYYAVPSSKTKDGSEIGAVRGVLRSILFLLDSGCTHLGVATDHVVESFRNDLWPGYKTSAGVPPELLAQFPILEEALEVMGVVVWPMVEFEADDALAAAAREAAAYAEQALICTPDKDLGQCVRDDLVVQFNRRTNALLNEAAITAKFGLPPVSIPDYLALVGDSADGYPGLPGWGAKTASVVLAKFEHIENIPEKWSDWGLPLRGGPVLAATLKERQELALLFKDLATLRTSVAVRATAKRLRWTGPTSEFAALAERFGDPSMNAKAQAIAAAGRAARGRK
jgi:5'-3' exonuclease